MTSSGGARSLWVLTLKLQGAQGSRSCGCHPLGQASLGLTKPLGERVGSSPFASRPSFNVHLSARALGTGILRFNICSPLACCVTLGELKNFLSFGVFIFKMRGKIPGSGLDVYVGGLNDKVTNIS